MAADFDYPAWIILSFGIYSFAAGVGELRNPGFWESMINNIEESPAVRFLTGLVLIAIGTPLYLLGPWTGADWMLVVVKIIGAGMILEGALFLAFGDWFVKFSKWLMVRASRLWVWIAVLFGIAAIILAELRIAETAQI